MEFEEFGRRIDMLREKIVNAIAYLTVWKELSDRDVETARALNCYRGMFLPAISAFQIMTLLEICKIFDRDSRTVSLRNLVRVAKEQREEVASGAEEMTPRAGEEDLKYIEEEIEKNEGLLKRLKRYRNKRIAHHDAFMPKKMRIEYGEIKKLVEDTESMYNKLRVGHDGQVTSFDRIVRDAERHTLEVKRVMREESKRLFT